VEKQNIRMRKALLLWVVSCAGERKLRDMELSEMRQKSYEGIKKKVNPKLVGSSTRPSRSVGGHETHGGEEKKHKAHEEVKKRGTVSLRG